ncbi:hypothetical protein L6270_03140 [Candidatus Parcubacteria bacterium]|nr:hypothetical protein [Patescibacteria group bacterium]MBU4308958.1 hypothetical protein [Patescibacteria group bacterium]MBU4431871.1 hypothetical protein [Patescibacteria group bacterium]MBU4577318.1 hypothetical protein [Patescibacteria group bacterium]MCG2697007.1 hypothetical protein [Candidatus Parcubacteria bacterium]
MTNNKFERKVRVLNSLTLKSMKKIKILGLLFASLFAFPVSAYSYPVGDCSCFCPTSGYSNDVAGSYLPIKNNNFYNRLKGRIIVTPQGHGEAYYVSATEKKVYYLGDNSQALRVMQGLGTGTNSATLQKVSTGYGKLTGYDTDRDGLPDNFESLIGTNPGTFNTDGDRYSDKTEIDNNYDPTVGNGKKLTMPANLKGRIFLQVDRDGEAWYMNPVDEKKYWVNTQDDMSNLIKKFGLGVSNYNFTLLVK